MSVLTVSPQPAHPTAPVDVVSHDQLPVPADLLPKDTMPMTSIFEILYELDQMEKEIAKADREYHRQVALSEEKQERAAKQSEIATYRGMLPKIFSILTSGAYLCSGVAGFGGEGWKSFATGSDAVAKAIGGVKEIEGTSTQGDRAEAQSLYAICNELKRIVDQERQHAVGEYDKALQRMERILERLSQLVSELLR